MTFEAGIALDVAALAVEPNLPNLVMVDALTLGAGKLIGKAIGAGMNRLTATEFGELVAAKVVPYSGVGGDITTYQGRTTTVSGKFNDPVNPDTGTKVILTMPDGSFTRGGQNPGGINILNTPTPEYNKLIADYGKGGGVIKYSGILITSYFWMMPFRAGTMSACFQTLLIPRPARYLRSRVRNH